MEIRLKSTGQVMYEGELRSYLTANDGPSYDQLTPEVMETIGVEAVLEGPQATGGTVYQYSVYGGVEQIDGKWFTKWNLGPSFFDTEDAEGHVTTAAENEAAYKAQKDAEQAVSVRNSRNDKLKECDWTQIADSTADKTLWATYRQALRDISSQAGFPWEITWPTQP